MRYARSCSIRARLLALALLAGCADSKLQPRTEVLLQVDADDEIRARAEYLTVAISSGAGDAGALTDTDPEVFDLRAATFQWPASLALIAKQNHEGHIFEVTLSAEVDDKPLARGRVRSGFLKGKTLVLTTSLFGVCIDMFSCADDETCVADGGGAKCVSADVDQRTLPAFIPASAGGSDSGDMPDGGRPSGSGGGGSNAGGSDAQMTGGMDSAVRDAGSESGTSPSGIDAAGGSGADASQDSGGGASGCVPNGPEDCFNGMDDDCNGATDCADAACNPSAICAPSSSVTGVLVAANASCPTGYSAGETAIYQGLTDPGCSGCSCTTSPIQCTARVYYYASTSACDADPLPYSGGTLLTPIPTYTCGSTPIGDSQGMSTPVAWRVSMTATPDACSPGGSAQPLPPTWAMSMKLCTASSVGGGCPQAFMCVPRVTGSRVCGQKSNAGICPNGAIQETWQRGYSDQRSCGPCTCIASGGSCFGVTVQLGHDWACSTIDGSLHGGEKSCSISTYMPPAILSGLPLNPICSASAAQNGSLNASAPIDLCCSSSGPISMIDTP